MGAASANPIWFSHYWVRSSLQIPSRALRPVLRTTPVHSRRPLINQLCRPLSTSTTQMPIICRVTRLHRSKQPPPRPVASTPTHIMTLMPRLPRQYQWACRRGPHITCQSCNRVTGYLRRYRLSFPGSHERIPSFPIINYIPYELNNGI